MIFALILLVLLGLSVVVNLGQFASSVFSVSGMRVYRTVGPRLDEVLLEDNGAHNKLAVIDVDGIITSGIIDAGGFSMVDVLKAQLDRAKEDDRVKAVLLRVDSPGGEVLASDDIYRHLTDFQRQAHKPVITSMGNLAASGGYYVSSASRWIVANDLTIAAKSYMTLEALWASEMLAQDGIKAEVHR